MTWTAVVPFKGSGERKTRLAGHLEVAKRQQLSQRLFFHVLEAVRFASGVSRLAVLSDVQPTGWDGDLILDEGRGLNVELDALAVTLGPRPLLIIHADLPLVQAGEIDALLSQADEAGCAIAPDRHGSGTNALALRDPQRFGFAFGPGSFDKHIRTAKGRARVVTRLGLGLDIDTPDDLDQAIVEGFQF